MDVIFNEDSIAEAVGELASGAAAGPDGIPAILLKNCIGALKVPLCILWRKSLTDGVVTSALQLSFNTPIFKGSLASNFRPVTLTSHVIKIFENIVVKELMTYLDRYSLFNEGQHGFRPGRSCVSQYMQHYQEIIKVPETGIGVDVVYLEFAKAFDKVDHEMLLGKFRKFGIDGCLFMWLRLFLTPRHRLTVLVVGPLFQLKV